MRKTSGLKVPGKRSLLTGVVGLLGVACVLATPTHTAADAPPERTPTRTVLIGVVESSETDFPSTTLRPTIEAIERHVPGARVSVVRLSSITLLSDIDRVRPDLFIAPSADFRRVLDATGAHPIATRLSTAAVNPAQSVGAAFVVRSDRSDITTLTDLKGKRTAATLPTALDGWLAARLEVQEAGYDSKDFFGDVHFMTYGVPNVVSSVLAGNFDVGILPACALERAEARGLVEPGALKVVAPVTDELLACRHSTKLYPDWVAGALPGTDPELARLMTIALLTPVKPADALTGGRYVWQVTSDFHAVRELERSLHLGEWAYLESWTPEALWRRFKWYVVAIVIALGLILFHEWRLRRLVDVRTRELREALAERARLEEAERAARLRLGELERMGAISQLCAMIAHELKQPVGSVINYMAVLRMRLAQLAAGSSTGKGKTPNPIAVPPAADATDAVDLVLSRAASGAEKEARRIAEIVDRVRAYAKREKRSPRPVDLYERLEAAVAGARRSRKGRIETDYAPADAAGHPILVEGDPLELELLFLNLIKNALEASAQTTDPAGPRVRVMLETGPQAPELAEGDVRVRVVDNGPRLPDEAFERLKRVSESVKADGLGLGLAIVRNIVDEHGARLALRRLPECGLEAAVTFDRVERFENSESFKSFDSNTTTRDNQKTGDPS
ncbi:sensor histidine kinase [Sutterella megalosphaeroides]|uniref:histidine kinase n=1 Tax=Sutterella megalosphaeroides TaxID=2494234 RepID=A0A2Z6IA81_9BURK|nr:sensor histidine kinase [Sutterella megalosphaeroides]BBF23395.1 sensor histidine kinase [Sutterella megalosphaeroides]